jgi:nucleotide-binding universal stress UspA family protein
MKFATALDSSEHSHRAFEKTLQLIKEGDELHLLHVLELSEPSLLDPFHDRIDRVLNEEKKQNAKKIRHKYEELCATKKVLARHHLHPPLSLPIINLSQNQTQIKFDYTELVGDPRNLLCDYARQRGIDVLILGSRGLGTVQRLFVSKLFICFFFFF